MEDLDALIDAFFLGYARAYAPLRTVHTPELPEELLVDAPDAFGWVGWEPRLNQGLEPNYAEIERVTGVALPPSYRRWHARYLTLDLDLGPFRLFGATPPDPLAQLREALDGEDQEARLRQLRLLPFGSEEVHEAGPLCFDGRAFAPDGEMPIVYWDRDRFREDDPEAAPDEELGPVVFSSFPRLLACAVHLLGAPVGDPVARARRILDFTRIDPEGAGSEGGFAYWTDYAGSLAGEGALPEEELAPPPDMVRRWWASGSPNAGFGAQNRAMHHALATLDRDPALSLELAQRVDEPALRARAAVLRIRALHALGRHHALEDELAALCEEWLGPVFPNAANQHVDREEMLTLAGLGHSAKVIELRERVAAAAEPGLVMPEGDTI